MMSLTPSNRFPAALGRAALLRFLREEYLRIMRGRLAKLTWAMVIYAVVTVPWILEKPPPEILHAIGAWLGAAAVPSKLVLFVWVDAAMNKFAMIMGPVLAGGILVDERSRGWLDLVASKPVRPADYFSVKLVAAAAAMATFYLAGAAGAILTFPWRVSGFDPTAFLALSAVHLFAVLFAVSLSATMAVLTRRRLIGMLASLSVLSLLVGLAFLGFYHPAYRGVSDLNPFFHGVALIGRMDNYGPGDLARPIAALVLFNLLVAWVGRRLAAAWLEDNPTVPRFLGRRTRPDRSRAPAQRRRAASVAAFGELEEKTGLGGRHFAMLALLSLMGLLAFWLPLFPESVFRFFNRVLHLSDWAEIVFVNELTGLFFFVYWIGVFDVLTVLVVPREERYLEILLAKPLSRGTYMRTRLLPIMAKAIGIGAVAAGFQWAGLVAAGLPYHPLAFLGAASATIGWAVLLVAVVNLLVVGARDSYTALLVAFVPMIVSTFPGMIYLYRPDLFDGMPTVRDVIVFPMNLVWSKETAAQWGAGLAGLMLALAVLLAGVAGRRTERLEVL